MKKGNYVDGFVLVIPKKKLAAYKKMAKEGKAAWMKFGALEYVECMGNDLGSDASGENGLGFIKMTKAKKNETVWFSYVVYKNKKHRDQVNKKVMDFFSKKYANVKNYEMPFDEGRMSRGGFSVEVS